MRLKSRLFTSLGSLAFVVLARMLFWTVKLRFEEETPGTNPYDRAIAKRYIYCVWHDSLMLPLFAGQHHATSALTSKHSDGGFVAAVLERLGIKVIRGSTNRIPLSTMRGLIDGPAGNHLVITPDGPRGPARQASPGMVYLASRMGLAIVPTAFHCTRYWKFPGSWTHLVIPKPFSTIVCTAGPPLVVPPELRQSELVGYLHTIQSEMDRLAGDSAGVASRKAA